MKGLTQFAHVCATIFVLSSLTSVAFGAALQVNARGDLVADDFYDWGSEYLPGDVLAD